MDIRNILKLITENSQPVNKKEPFSAKMQVMSLPQFVEKSEEEQEVDEAKLDAPARVIDGEDLESYLDRVIGTPFVDPKTGEVKKTPRGTEKYVSGKTKQDKFKLPYVHRSNVVPIVDETGSKYDLDALRDMITKRPAKILKQNEKMQHSDGTASVFYNIGLPALKGLAYDEENQNFVVIDTCPGAGQCQVFCFAMKGGYVQWKGVSLSQSRLLNFLYNDPDGFMYKLGEEIASAYKRYNKKGKQTKLAIRWHDAGDFFSTEYLDKAYELARRFPTVDFYAYTKIAAVAKSEKPENFIINFSMGAKPSQEREIDFTREKNSRVVSEVLFKDLVERTKDGKLVYKDEQSLQTLKNRIAAKYSVDPDSIITYDQMMKIPKSEERGKWNVIVKQGDGDDSANRNDVLNTFLLMH